MEIFAQRLKELRNSRRVYQKEMAEYLGITVRGYQCYEAGQNYPDVKGLIALADYFGVTTDYLLGRSDQR
ncbi:helix-turn-helix domain-containing protein [Dysosmobacter sp.]|uniref:helix-turn-helix domain-containing protein n=1 Tax=Dysosmobacter sp. TaxID=2591382 RepID=UPI002A88C146|nr:helix-turn-helix transcriptional regulator [Dysosmobacter sp.]MDY3985929.1 helix-turn-helix transcriptional regulator [Dysosmobacter sp.]